MLKQLAIASFALTAIIAAPSAHAQASEPHSVKVTVEGIDMNSDRGARVVLQRIRYAAEEVCGDHGRMTLDNQLQFKPCVKETVANTVAGLHSPTLTALLDNQAIPGSQTKVASAR